MLTQPKTVLISENIVAMTRSYQVAINNMTEKVRLPNSFYLTHHTHGLRLPQLSRDRNLELNIQKLSSNIIHVTNQFSTEGTEGSAL